MEHERQETENKRADGYADGRIPANDGILQFCGRAFVPETTIPSSEVSTQGASISEGRVNSPVALC